MSKSTQRKRWFVMVHRWTGAPKRCRTCTEWIATGSTVWSPYYGGGRYHLNCEAMPAVLPPAFPGEEHRCSSCSWLMKEPTSPACSRCVRLSMVVLV